MELLLLAALGAGIWVLWKQARGEEPTPGMFGRAFAGCLGLGCLGLVVMFAIAVVVVWLLLQGLADLDLSLFTGDGQDPGAGDGDDGLQRS